MICSIDGCNEAVRARRWCGKHYQHWQKTGDPLTSSVEERFWSKVDASGDCWVWTAYRNSAGYGTFARGAQQSPWRAHRWAWEHLVGPIPDGMQIDHLCRKRACVNPDHLEVVTSAANTLRGYGTSACHKRQTHCKRGHPLAGDNLYVRPNGTRRCRTCDHARLSDGYNESRPK